MPDWKSIVREKLGTFPLTNGRRDEVIEELAQQLESAYEEALAQGITEQEALRGSLAQFKDWEKLRMDLFQSVEGTRLPVWEQNGFFAPRRWPVWVALALTLLLLAAPAFRQALAIFPVPGTDPTSWGSRVVTQKDLRRLEQSGDKQRYARALAFVALHSRKDDDLLAMHAAEKAIALDPQLTWISAKISHATYLFPGYDPHPWIERLKAWDPQNAFPYLLEASASVHSDWETRWAKYNAATPDLRNALAAEPKWRVPMDKAFAAPRIDFYEAQRFALDRQVLQEQGFNRPDIFVMGMWSQPMPSFMETSFYTEIQLKDVGEVAEKAGRPSDALAAYESVARFGELLRAGSSWDLTQLLAVKYRREAYEKMLPLLRREGRAEEAAAVEPSLLEAATYKPRSFAVFGGVAERSARIVQLSGFLAVLLAVATLVWFFSLIILRRRPRLSPALNRFASALCGAPPLLLLSSLALLLAYYPYARPVAQYASAQDLHEGYGLFFMSVYDFSHLDIITDVLLERMFWPTVWCAAIAVAGACLLWFVRLRTRPDRPDVA